jgi:hypothetical protein
MIENILTKLNFSVDIKELHEYYNTLNTKFQHLDWSWDRCGDTIVKQWRDAAYADPANLLTHGWAIQSNLKDLTLPCPPWNISTLETTEYRNTELAFGIVERLQAAIPYAYRWAVSVQPSGGKVSLHSDQEDECTVWIPIYSNNDSCITFVVDNTETPLKLSDDGSAYMLDTGFPHYTFNNTKQDRVTIIFRLNRNNIKNLLSVQGII